MTFSSNFTTPSSLELIAIDELRESVKEANDYPFLRIIGQFHADRLNEIANEVIV